jgi:hypothetical protein
MVNKQKLKGSGFERDLVKILNEKIPNGVFRRIPGSGAIGTIMHEGSLTADVSGKVIGFPRSFKLECKDGYGGETQLTFKREWLNKVREQAQTDMSFPAVIGKFSGARKADGTQIFAVIDIEDFIYLINLISDLAEDEGNGK